VNVDFFHVADEAVISREGKLTAVGIFDLIWTASVPAVHPKLALLARVSGHLHEGSRHEMQVQFVDEDGALVWESPAGPLDLNPRGPGYPMTANVAVSIAFLDLPKFGDYDFKLIVDGSPIGTAPLSVRPLAELQG
jgi:hypothetical protein